MPFFFFQRIPKVTVSRDEGLVELEISDDPYDVQRVEVQSAPCIVTVCKVLLILIITLQKLLFGGILCLHLVSIYVGVTSAQIDNSQSKLHSLMLKLFHMVIFIVKLDLIIVKILINLTHASNS